MRSRTLRIPLWFRLFCFVLLAFMAIAGHVPAVHQVVIHSSFLAILFGKGAFAMAVTGGVAPCPNPADVFRARTEYLGEFLHLRASWRYPWPNLIPRAEWDQGAGFVQSSFEIGRSEPNTDEEVWQQVVALEGSQGSGSFTNNNPINSGLTYNQVYVGELERTYVPEAFGLRGPYINQDALPMYWNTPAFWAKYYDAIEKRNTKSIVNRMANVYMSHCYKACCGTGFSWVPGFNGGYQVPAYVDLSTVINNNGLPNSELTQDYLDQTAVTLNQEGAFMGDTNAWIRMEEAGPVYPLLIGQEMSNRILLNNAELRSDFNQSFQGWGDLNPVIKRMGAKRVVKNFRHMIDLFPPRWARMTHGQQINYASTLGNGGASVGAPGVQITVDCSIVGGIAAFSFTAVNGYALPVPATYTAPAAAGSAMLRIPTFAMAGSGDQGGLFATVGNAGVVNGCWLDSTIAAYEGCTVLNPLVVTERVLMPINSLAGAKLNVQNYFGEWDYVTGNDAVLGQFANCNGISDPKRKVGAHFAEYRCGWEPTQPVYGRFLLYLRCGASSLDTVSCS